MDSLYKYKHDMHRSIASLIIGLALASSIWYGLYRGAENNHQYDIAIEEDISSIKSGIIFDKDTEILELRALIADLNEQFKLVATLRQVGWEAETPTQARALLAELSKLPLGAPFTSRARVTSRYGVYTVAEYGWNGVDHPGIDLTPLNGNPAIMLPAEAEVIDYGDSYLWGLNMTLETSNGYQLFFAHLDRIFWHDLDGDTNWSLSIGDILPRGTKIANMGSTGAYSTNTHLHYEIRVQDGDTWKTLDPQAIIEYTGAIQEVS